MTIKNDEMFTEDDIPDFSKLGADKVPASVEKLLYRIDHLASAAVKAHLSGDFALGGEMAHRLNRHSDYIVELMPNAE